MLTSEKGQKCSMSVRRMFYLLACAGLILVAGCQNNALPSGSPTPGETVAATGTTIPATQTLLAPTPTAESGTLPTDSVIQTQCPEVSTSFTPSDFTRGTLIYDGPLVLNTLLNLQTGEKSDLGPGSGPVVSPARDQLEYSGLNETSLSRFLVIRKVGNPKQVEQPFLKGTLLVVGWLDEQHLLFRIKSDSSPYGLAILDPYTGEVKELNPQIPNLLPDRIWLNFGPAVFDRTLDYVLYASRTASEKRNRYVLWQISSGKELASLPGSENAWPKLSAGNMISIDGVSHNIPQWSPADTRVALISAAPGNPNIDEVFALTKDGQVQRLTYFANHYDTARIRTLSWSPDGKSIAFWLTLSPAPFDPEPATYQNERLAVLNTETLGISLYCISGDSIGVERIDPQGNFIADEMPAPIWSPDGKQLIVENRYAISSGRMILLDIPSNTGIQIGQNLEPLGWMIGMP